MAPAQDNCTPWNFRGRDRVSIYPSERVRAEISSVVMMMQQKCVTKAFRAENDCGCWCYFCGFASLFGGHRTHTNLRCSPVDDTSVWWWHRLGQIYRPMCVCVCVFACVLAAQLVWPTWGSSSSKLRHFVRWFIITFAVWNIYPLIHPDLMLQSKCWTCSCVITSLGNIVCVIIHSILSIFITVSQIGRMDKMGFGFRVLCGTTSWGVKALYIFFENLLFIFAPS